MIINNFKIIPPEGMEAYKDGDEIKFRPIKKVTYNDVAEYLFCDNNMYYIDQCANINRCCVGVSESVAPNPVNCISENQAKKLLAINKLMNVAAYLNTTKNTDGCQFVIDNDNNLGITWFHLKQNDGCIRFKTEELAKKALEILGEETIRTAISNDW